MKNYPIEKQVCSLGQARELAELLGDDAPRSLWMWAKMTTHINFEVTWTKHVEQYSGHIVEVFDCKVYPAYTGDELGALLKNSAKWKEYSGHATAEEKAALAIQGLKAGWIKPEEFKYD